MKTRPELKNKLTSSFASSLSLSRGRLSCCWCCTKAWGSCRCWWARRWWCWLARRWWWWRQWPGYRHWSPRWRGTQQTEWRARTSQRGGRGGGRGGACRSASCRPRTGPGFKGGFYYADGKRATPDLRDRKRSGTVPARRRGSPQRAPLDHILCSLFACMSATSSFIFFCMCIVYHREYMGGYILPYVPGTPGGVVPSLYTWFVYTWSI